MKTNYSSIKLIILFSLSSFVYCSNNGQNLTNKVIKNNDLISKIESPSLEQTQIICDTVYKNKSYRFTLVLFDTTNNFPDEANNIFTFEKLVNGQYKIIYRDSIYCENQEIQFKTFTTDNIKSILVKNNKDIRGNWTYYMYKVDTTKDKLIKIKGFEEIKNPNFIFKCNIIDNYVMSGKNWTSFYKLESDSVKHFNIVIYDNQKELDGNTYKNGYNKALKSILAKEKSNN